MWAYAVECRCAKDLLLPALGASVIGFGGMICILCTLLFADFHWRTSGDGLWSRCLVRRKLVRWEEMRRAPRLMRGPSLVDHRMIVLKAAVWQHLLGLGNATDMAVDEDMLSLWDQIPDELPKSIGWRNPASVRLWCRAALVVSCALALLGFGYMAMFLAMGKPHHLWESMWFCWLMAAICWEFILISGVYYETERITLDGNRLYVRTARRSIDLAPSDVTSAWWDAAQMLHLKTPKAHFALPLNSIDDGSSQMILAIIRWLRTAPTPVLVPIPQMLRAPFDEELLHVAQRSALESAEVRLSLAEKVLILTLTLMIVSLIVGAAVHSWPADRIAVAVTSVAIGAGAVVWWVASSFKMCVDHTAVTKSFMGWKRRASWSDVASYTVGNHAGSGVQNATIRCTLWSAEGRRLLSISSRCGSKEQWDRFMRFIYARILEAVPEGQFLKPYKSKPYSLQSPSAPRQL